MFELMVLRHAKSDWGTDASSDHERPLSSRGNRAAQKMGQFLAQAGRVPSLALSSTAVRARTTAESILNVARTLGHDPPALVTHRELYGASVDQWLAIVADAIDREPNPPPRILVASHEPTCSGVVHALTGAHCRFPTGAVATVRLAGPEALLASSRPRGVLESFVIPRLLD